MRKNATLIAITIIVMMVMNGLLPRYAVCTRGYDHLFLLVKNQPLLQQFTIVSMIPVMIANRLLARGQNAGGHGRQGRTGEEPVNGSADFSVVSGKSIGGKALWENTVYGGAWGMEGVSAWIHRWCERDRGRNRIPPAAMIIAVYVMMFMVMRPRGCIDERIYFDRSMVACTPIWNMAKWGFLLGSKR